MGVSAIECSQERQRFFEFQETPIPLLTSQNRPLKSAGLVSMQPGAERKAKSSKTHEYEFASFTRCHLLVSSASANEGYSIPS